MAAPMLKNLGSGKFLRLCRITDCYRNFLSEAYKCDQLWKERLKSPYLEKINPSTFGVEVLENFDDSKTLHSVDVDIFANKIHELEPRYGYLVPEILHRFRHSNMSVPIHDNIMHAVVRGFIERNDVISLVDLIKDKPKYGVFPDDQAMCMLLDLLISSKEYETAAELAYEVMLQEEYQNQTRNLLALNAAVKHFCHTMNLERKEPEPQPDESEETEYIAVRVIRNLYYDDHFDIKDERFLLGKTFYNLSRNTEVLDDTLSRSLQLIGLGLYEKFELANQLLEKWISEADNKPVVSKQAIKHYGEFLSSTPTRDPDAEPKSMGDKTIDDEIELLKLTPESKEKCIKTLENLSSSLSEDQLPSIDIEQKVDAYMSSTQFKKYQQEDIKALEKNYKQWMADRAINMEKYLSENKRLEKETEIQEKLAALYEREELLVYFEHKYDIENLASKRPKEKFVRTETEEYVDVPGERNVNKAVKRRK